MEVIDLEDVLAQARSASLTRDNPLLADLPSWFSGLRDHQRVAIREILTAYEEGAECVVLDAPTGCLAGDTDIIINRGGKSTHSSLRDLVHKFNGGAPRGGKSWDLSIPTMVQCADDGFIRLGRLAEAWSSGIKETYTVRTINRTIRATLTHPFLTENGYELLGNLSVGHSIARVGKRTPNTQYVKKYYPYETGLVCHPYASNKRTYEKCEGWRVPKHRLMMEAVINGFSYTSWVQVCKFGLSKYHEGEVVFLNPAKDAVHHKDGNSLNYQPSNLEILPHVEHWALEGKEHAWKHLATPVAFEAILDIEYYGEEMTYDLELAEEPHNFIANGCAVHNSGKTLIGETVRRLLDPPGRQTSYICSSKALQDQFVRDYPYARVLKGRSNYATERYPERFGPGVHDVSCADCTKVPGDAESCMWCVSVDCCPYERAKSDALRSQLAVLNTSYFLAECNGPGRFSYKDSNGYRSQLVIADESDCLEGELMSHVEVRVSERRLKSYGLSVPKYVTKEESWREWAEDAYEKVRANRPRPIPGNEVQTIRQRKRHDILVAKLKDLVSGLENHDWVYTGDRSAVAFKPVTVSLLGQEKLWQHGDKWLLMSATVISADEMLESLGWDEDKSWRLVKCPSTFKPENRKVVVWPVADMTFKKKDESYPRIIRGIGLVLAEHPHQRVLIHSTSYELTRAIEAGILDRQTFTYTESAGKEAIMTAWLESPDGVLIAPSMDRGVDLPGDKCRVQIITKVPYGNLKDKQISARKWSKGGALWYSVTAIRTVIQMCGRIVRGPDDWGVTYLLDGQFTNNLWASNRRLFPQWWKESLVWRKGME